MNLSKKILISKNIVTEKINDYAFMYNKESKEILYFDLSILEAFHYAVNEKLNIKEFLEIFQYEDDKKYVKALLEEMYIKKFIIDKIEENKIEKTSRNITIMLTNKCNLVCKHCCFSCSPEMNTEIDFEKLINFIKKINKDVSIEQIVFSGGEPLLYKKFEYLVKTLRSILYNSKFILSTNGTLLDNRNTKFISYFFDCVYLSLDGHDEASTSKIRGKGVFKKVIESVKLLQESGVKEIYISATLGNNQSVFNEEEFYKINYKLGTIPIIRRFSEEGRGKENTSMFNVNNSIKYNINIKTKSNVFKAFNAIGCNALEGQLYIDADGDIYPCPSLSSRTELKISNISNFDVMDDIKQAKGGYDLFIDECSKSTKCSKCNYKLLCWSCTADIERFLESEDFEKMCAKKMNVFKKIFS